LPGSERKSGVISPNTTGSTAVVAAESRYVVVMEIVLVAIAIVLVTSRHPTRDVDRTETPRPNKKRKAIAPVNVKT
jgi:hypothetical protein